MEEKLVYLSSEWAEEVLNRLKVQLQPEKMNNITTSMSNIYKNCPQGKEMYLFIRCENGSVTEVKTGSGEAPKAEFTITGDYETFAKISRAEMGSQRALMTGRLKLKGNMAKALRLASLADRMNKIISSVPAVY